MDPVDRADTLDPVVEAYKEGVDRTWFDRSLQLTSSERIEQLQRFVAFLADVRQAGRKRAEAGGSHVD